jgi:hypothetical protein
MDVCAGRPSSGREPCAADAMVPPQRRSPAPVCRYQRQARFQLRPAVLGRRSPSGDLPGDRHAEAGHAVDHLAGDPGLDLLREQTPGAEAPADQNFVPVESRFHECPPAIARHGLPAHSAFPGEHPDVPVALSGSVAAVSSALVGNGSPLPFPPCNTAACAVPAPVELISQLGTRVFKCAQAPTG